MLSATKLSSTTKFRDQDGAIETDEDSGKDFPSDGAKATSCAGARVESGFGGLRLAGMVGSDDSEGGSATPPGEGNKGVMSGDRAGEDTGTLGNNAGAAEMVETLVLMFSLDAMANEEQATKTVNIANIDQKEAINDDEINCCVIMNRNKMCFPVRERERVNEKRKNLGGMRGW